MKLVLHRNYSIKLYNRDDKSMILISKNSCSTKKEDLLEMNHVIQAIKNRR